MTQGELQDEMRKLGWEFFQTGPNEGEWLLFVEGQVYAREGDPLWQIHLRYVKRNDRA